MQQSMSEYANKLRRAPGQQKSTVTGMIEPGNIDLSKRKVVPNADGSVSTIVSSSFNIGGQEVLLPTLDPDGKKMTPDETVARYKRTGEHLGKFSSPEAATAYAKQASKGQERLRRPDETPEQYLARTGIK
jgi:hypothetical protein